MSPALLLTGKYSPVKAGWSTLRKSPSKSLTFSGNDIARAETYNIPRNQLGGGNFLPLAVSKGPGFESQSLSQGLEGVGGLVFLPETHQGIEDQQDRDNDEIIPMPDDRQRGLRRLLSSREWDPENE